MSTPSAPFWSTPAAQLLDELQVTLDGLSSAEAVERLTRVGPNEVVSVRQHSTARLLLSQFTSPTTLLLGVAASLSMLAGEFVDGAIILVILLVSGLLGFWQEQRAADAVARLLALVQSSARVVRDGADVDVPLAAVVPGDIVRLRAGASIPGDARLLEVKDLCVDEAALTGESYPAEKDLAIVTADAPVAARSNAVFLGTHVVSGIATALVVRTGPQTEFGMMARRLAGRSGETGFEHGVHRVGGLLLQMALVLALIIFAVNVALHRPVLDALLFTLALTVGLTPQLLPAIVSVTLAQGARHLARERVIVRRLGAIEDLGGMQILCTDKTGTLTEGIVAVQGSEDWRGEASSEVLTLACRNAHFATGFDNPIDTALRAHQPLAAAEWRKVDEVPYDFVRKRLSIAMECGAVRLLVTKGAVRPVLEACDRVVGADGRELPLASVRAAIDARVGAVSRTGTRCLAIATRVLAPDAPLGREAERGLTFAGLVTFSDPLKPAAIAALGELRRLHVHVKMITGDHRLVAKEIARQAGLASDAMVTGPELHTMSAAALTAAAARVDVFAEVEPNQKEHIIAALRRSGQVVGFLGDGINDAAALHAADCGISVDTAADVTKDAADFVLLEKDLGVLARGVQEGRRTFANTLKYVLITTSANLGNMVSMAIASCFTAFLPMLPTQVLLLNVLSDLPAMAVATDRLDPELLAVPRRWSTDAIRRFMLTFGLVSSAFDMLTFGTLVWLAVPPAAFRTAWFLESLLSEVLVLLIIRTRRPFMRSPIGRGLLVSSVVVAVGALVLPSLPGSGALGFAILPWRLVALVIAIVALYGTATEFTKRALRGRRVML